VDRIEKTAHRAEQMIADLLVYAKTEKDTRGDFEFIETRQVIREIIEELKLKWQPCPVSFTVQEDLPEILFHPGSFRQIFSNLIDNAIKYSRDAPAPHIAIKYKLEPEGVVFSVTDNGPGIDPALHEKIFDIFERGERSEEVEGTGIGLAIIKRIVETHHGHIWVESEKGQGAAFYIRLPVRTLQRPIKPSVT
jgi:signal transduction histidine kinase